jgi:hypothetical protein
VVTGYKILIEKLATAGGLTSQLVTDGPALSCAKDVWARYGVGANQGKNSLRPLVRNAQLLRRFFQREWFKLKLSATRHRPFSPSTFFLILSRLR